MRFALVLFALAGCEPGVGALRSDLDIADASVDAGLEVDAAPPEPAPDGGAPRVVFRRDIRPIIARGDGPPAGCKRCHYKNESAPQGYELGGLDLTTLGTLRKGGVSSGKQIVVAGDPDSSVIVKKIEGIYARGARMPKDLTPLSADEIALIRRWIAEGAEGTDDE